jgi:hypothetical protein
VRFLNNRLTTSIITHRWEAANGSINAAAGNAGLNSGAGVGAGTAKLKPRVPVPDEANPFAPTISPTPRASPVQPRKVAAAAAAADKGKGPASRPTTMLSETVHRPAGDVPGLERVGGLYTSPHAEELFKGVPCREIALTLQQGIRDSLDLVDALPERSALTKDFGDQTYLPCRDPKGTFYSFAPFFFRQFRDQQYEVFNEGEVGTPVAEVRQAFRRSITEEPLHLMANPGVSARSLAPPSLLPCYNKTRRITSRPTSPRLLPFSLPIVHVDGCVKDGADGADGETRQTRAQFSFGARSPRWLVGC